MKKIVMLVILALACQSQGQILDGISNLSVWNVPSIQVRTCHKNPGQVDVEACSAKIEKAKRTLSARGFFILSVEKCRIDENTGCSDDTTPVHGRIKFIR